MQTVKRLKPMLAAMIARCSDEEALMDCMELLMGKTSPRKPERNGAKPGRKSRISDATCRKVVELHGRGMTNYAVAGEAEIGLSTVSRILLDSRNGDTFGKKKVKKRKKQGS